MRLVDSDAANVGCQVVLLEEGQDLRLPIIVDIDGDGHVLGLEFLKASEMLPARLLDEFR